jgi:ATP-dependent DNA helicase RecQ
MPLRKKSLLSLFDNKESFCFKEVGMKRTTGQYERTSVAGEEEAAQQTQVVLNDVFGFHSFRRNQEEIVQAILAKQDAFVVMPTGGGKSLCYQLPAHVMDGTCIVISPLISLMKDQVDAAIATGLRASFLNSSLSAGMKREVESQLAAGELDLIYVSPERFAMPEFIATLKRVELSFVAIDEAHCISEWGHDFRPDYLNLSSIVQEFPDVPVAAFTATATHKVQDDIVSKLGLRSPHMVRASFNRPNLFYKVIPKQKPSDQILRFVRDHAGEPGIIYRTTRKSVEQTATMLTKHGIKALPYHAGLADATRVKNQDAFNKDEVDVIVATIAFGMGIDKSNVRYVLHGDLPKNMESYYQETGRSGRDGEPAHCLFLFGYGDIPKIRFFFNEITDETEKKHAIKCLNDMVHYASVHACRRKQLLNYFGEEWPPAQRSEIGSQRSAASGSPDRRNPEKTGSLLESSRSPTSELRSPISGSPCCDICQGEVESIDGTRDAQIVMSAIARTGERFGINHVIAVVTGDDTDRIRQLGHDQIKTFGVGKDQDKRHWRLMIDNLLAQSLIIQREGDYPILQLQPESREVLFGDRKVHILKSKKLPPKTRRRRAEMGGPVRHNGRSPLGGYNEDLFEALRDLRKKLASEQGVPPYIIFSDKTLHEMARCLPTTERELLHINGIGETKLERYGKAFMDAIATFRVSHPDAETLGSCGSGSTSP